MLNTSYGTRTKEIFYLNRNRNSGAPAATRVETSVFDFNILQERVTVHLVCMADRVLSTPRRPIRATVPTPDTQECIAKVRC